MAQVGPTREQVFQALFAKLQKIPGITTAERRFTMPEIWLSERNGDLPALMLLEEPLEETVHTTGKPRNRIWDAMIIVVFQNESKIDPGATLLNPVLEGIEAALAPDDPWDAASSQTLGGLVNYCRIEGVTHKQTGDTDSQGLGFINVPIRIRVP